MQVPDWQCFMDRFASFGREPGIEKYLDLFDPRGTVKHPGMEKPIAGDEIAAFISSALANMPDFLLRPTRWCHKHDTLFVEAECSGSVGGRRARWPALYCLALRGERVLRGRAYYDRATVLCLADPNLADRRDEAYAMALSEEGLAGEGAGDAPINESTVEPIFLNAYAAHWQAPVAERFAEFYSDSGKLLVPGTRHALRPHEVGSYYAALFRDISDLRQQSEAWAYRAGLLFVEWRMSGSKNGDSFELGTADRITLSEDGRIVEAVSYFDTLALDASEGSRKKRQTVFAGID